jgi:hypothetical protein
MTYEKNTDRAHFYISSVFDLGLGSAGQHDNYAAAIDVSSIINLCSAECGLYNA